MKAFLFLAAAAIMANPASGLKCRSGLTTGSTIETDTDDDCSNKCFVSTTYLPVTGTVTGSKFGCMAWDTEATCKKTTDLVHTCVCGEDECNTQVCKCNGAGSAAALAAVTLAAAVVAKIVN